MPHAKKSQIATPAQANAQPLIPIVVAVQADRWLRNQALQRGWQLVNIFYSRNLPGFVPKGALVSLLPDDPQVLELRQQCPVVRYGSFPHDADSQVPAVLPDDHAEGRMAAEFFASCGVSAVGYFGQTPWGNGKFLYDGLESGAARHGLPCHLCQFTVLPQETTKAKEQRRNQIFTEWLRTVPKPFGLLAPGPGIVATYVSWVCQAGFQIPDEIAILSRGDAGGICECFIPAISVIDRNEKDRMEAACDLLARCIAGEPLPSSPLRVPPKMVIERETTSILAPSDPVVGSALRVMAENLADDLGVPDIARAVHISPRQLERRFHDALGRSVNQELRRRRLAEVKRLLAISTYPMSDIARLVGFGSTTYLHRAFRAAFGQTPDHYRKSTS